MIYNDMARHDRQALIHAKPLPHRGRLRRLAMTLFLFLVAVDSIATTKDEAFVILEAHGLRLNGGPNGCAVAEIGQPTRVIKVSCMGEEYKALTARAKEAFEDAGYEVEKSGLGFTITKEQES